MNLPSPTTQTPIQDRSPEGDSETFSIQGQVGSTVFPRWIERHAKRLGLRVSIQNHSADILDMIVIGPHDLRDAMALGCSLGPWDVWVETIDRTPC